MIFCQGNEGKVQLLSGIPPDPDLLFRSAQHDSRQVGSGDLFVAIKGQRWMGTNSSLLLRRQELWAFSVPSLLVLYLLTFFSWWFRCSRGACCHRTCSCEASATRTMIALTGSNGRTTTKEAIAAILSQQALTLKTYASYNNQVGLL